MSDFKLTYATMFDPPEELHARYDSAVPKVRAGMGKTCGMLINNRDHQSNGTFENRSPVNTDWLLAHVAEGTAQDANLAVAAARAAFPKWSSTPWKTRVQMVRRVADTIEDRLFELAAATTLNVGKNRLESLGDIQEAVDLLRAACESMERNNGYTVRMGSEPLPGHVVHNVSVMKPYGVWLVISPFNFPASLTCGPVGAALVSGNTVVTKPSVETAWVVRLLAECFRDAGLPDGVFNYVTGQNNPLGQALLDNPEVAGITFTGSYAVGMKIYRENADFRYPRPLVLEMGGKNAAVVSRNADVERAAWGIVRSGFGAQGQKCSAPSRVFAEEPIYDKLLERVVDIAKPLTIGDPTERNVYLGPVIRERSYQGFKDYCRQLSESGKVVLGGRTLNSGALAKGFYCEPTVAVEVPRGHALWKHEMFVPIVMIERVKDLNEAFELSNCVDYGLTGGFFGTRSEAERYLDQIQVGVAYVNRAQGACTGAWPGYQSFGGWKASGCTGKGSGGPYYLLSYLREQSQTIVD
ncbi:MAG TPA: aldehyde dehydrogenase family protein [Terriglobales bacterium]|nr:aldehyde dehydrogenase family protein [Terriglobales bacterium]